MSLLAHLNRLDAALLVVLVPELPKPVVPLLEKGGVLGIGTEIDWLG